MELVVTDIDKKHPQPTAGFEELYNAVRQYEQKVYTDEQLQYLPRLDTHSAEWQIRKHSSGRLLAYLANKRKNLKILEVGCGNGWLSAKLAALPHTQVTGLDISQTEISQAKRVFKNHNLEFICAGFNETAFNNEKFDVIVFSAALQYFPSIGTVLHQAMKNLNDGGEIHITDTPFYNSAEAEKAAERCRGYYIDMGIPEMANHYFHHSISEFGSFNYQVLFNPGNPFNRLFKKSPFYWITVTN